MQNVDIKYVAERTGSKLGSKRKQRCNVKAMYKRERKFYTLIPALTTWHQRSSNGIRNEQRKKQAT